MSNLVYRLKKYIDFGNIQKPKTNISKADSDSEKIEFLLDVVLTLQKDNARLRQDIREIVREQIKSILDGRQRQTAVFPV